MKVDTRGDDGAAMVRQYEYADGVVVAADLGVAVDEEATVDVVDDTAIVVVESEQGPVEREFDLPEGAAEAFIKNGVVTIEVR